MSKTKKGITGNRDLAGGINHEKLMGDLRILDRIKKGYVMPVKGLLQYFTANSINMSAQSFWTTMKWLLTDVLDSVEEDDWGTIQYGDHPWEVMEVKNKADFLQKFIDPILSKGKEVIATYDQTTQKAFEECEKAVVKANKQGQRRTPNPPSPETIERDERVRQLKEQGLTQREIAMEVKIAQPMVSRIINSTPSPDSNITSTGYNVTSGGYNVSQDTERLRPQTRGNSSQYRQARLMRDAPELAEKVRTGELSAHKAAKKLGLVKSQSFSLGPKTDPAAIAQKMVDFNKDLAISIALEIQNLCTEEQL